MISTTLPVVLVASLLGSLHCAAMCGGFVCFYSGGTEGAEAIRGHALYNLGRFVAYISLGAAAGVVGATVTQLGVLAGVGNAAAIAAAVLMIAWGASTLISAAGIKVGSKRAPEAWQRFAGRILHSVRSQSVGNRAFLTGLLTTLIPCGWLYVFVVAAAGTGSVYSSMATMAAFWLGTVPAMVTVGVSAQKLSGRFIRFMPVVGASVVLVLGLLSLAYRLSTPALDSHAHSGHGVHHS